MSHRALSRVSPQQLQRLLLVLANCNGQVINASAIGRDIGVDFKTVQRYLDVAARGLHHGTISPFFMNVAKRVRKSPKLYFRDTGLLHALLGLENVGQIQTWCGMGFSWESFCIEHLIHDACLTEGEFDTVVTDLELSAANFSGDQRQKANRLCHLARREKLKASILAVRSRART